MTVHNIHHQLDLMRRLREAIDRDQVQHFLWRFLDEQFGKGDEQRRLEVPQWVRNALEFAGYTIERGARESSSVQESG